jgi:arylsulfatase A-like enzyme
MTVMKGLMAAGLFGALVLTSVPAATTQARQRNVVFFIADGLRHGSVNERDAPTLWRLRTEGVHFENSHSLFPTFTTANASAIATGHGLGDTGDFSNTIWIGYATYDSGNFGLGPGTPVPFIENDQILADLHSHFGGNYLGERTLLDVAAAHGYSTAAIGKLGPTAIQASAAVAAVNGGFPPPAASIVIDDSTGTSNGPALPPRLLELLGKARLSPEAPARNNGYGATSPYNNGNAGTNTRAGTLAANLVQQQWLTDVATRAVLPMFESDGKPFALVFWSRDPDGTQHNQGDSLGKLAPGINGPTARQAVQNADRALAQLLAWLDAHPAVKANTDVFVTSDHGFATISRREVDRDGRATASKAATHYYVDAAGAVDTAKGMLPWGFLAIDLSLDLQLPLFDPERRSEGTHAPYRRVRLTLDTWEHPASGNGLIGTNVFKADGSDATAIVAANGGSDLIYVPDGKPDTVKRIVELLLAYDYVGGVFVDDKYDRIPGTVPLSDIGLVGATKLPRPAIVVAFKVFYLDPDDLQTAVQICDTGLQEGQGMHGGFGRDSTYNNMAAIGPDFKPRFVDQAPVSNADIAPTLARMMGLELTSEGPLAGRVLQEAMKDGPAAPAVRTELVRSPAASGRLTLLQYQELGRSRYFDYACIIPADQPAAGCR